MQKRAQIPPVMADLIWHPVRSGFETALDFGVKPGMTKHQDLVFGQLQHSLEGGHPAIF